MFLDLSLPLEPPLQPEDLKRMMKGVAIAAILDSVIGQETLKDLDFIFKAENGTKFIQATGQKDLGGIMVPVEFEVWLDEQIFFDLGRGWSFLMFYGIREEEPAAICYWMSPVAYMYSRDFDVYEDEKFSPELHWSLN